MTAPVSLSALRAARAKMTPGEWRRETDWHVFSDEYAEREVASTQFADDAAGIVATHAAADTLLEIAEAALALREQERKADRARFECHRHGGRSIPDVLIVDLANAEAELVACQDAYNAALAKVAP